MEIQYHIARQSASWRATLQATTACLYAPSRRPPTHAMLRCKFDFSFPFCFIGLRSAIASVLIFFLFRFFRLPSIIFSLEKFLDNFFTEIELKNYVEDMLRSCILNFSVKGCAKSLSDNISIEVVLKIIRYKFFFKKKYALKLYV